MEFEVLLDEGSHVPEAVVVPSPLPPDVVVVSLQQCIVQVLHQHFLLELVLSSQLDQDWNLLCLP